MGAIRDIFALFHKKSTVELELAPEEVVVVPDVKRTYHEIDKKKIKKMWRMINKSHRAKSYHVWKSKEECARLRGWIRAEHVLFYNLAMGADAQRGFSRCKDFNTVVRTLNNIAKEILRYERRYKQNGFSIYLYCREYKNFMNPFGRFFTHREVFQIITKNKLEDAVNSPYVNKMHVDLNV